MMNYAIDCVECTREEFLKALDEIHAGDAAQFLEWEKNGAVGKFERNICEAIKVKCIVNGCIVTREEFLNEMSANYHPDVFDGYMQWEESDSFEFENGIFQAVKGA